MPLTFKNLERPPDDLARGLAAAAAVFDARRCLARRVSR
jgi:hypothetical protein